jgi:hypothetical protein
MDHRDVAKETKATKAVMLDLVTMGAQGAEHTTVTKFLTAMAPKFAFVEQPIRFVKNISRWQRMLRQQEIVLLRRAIFSMPSIINVLSILGVKK